MTQIPQTVQPPVQASTTNQPNPMIQSKKKSKAWIFIILGILGILCIMCTCCLVSAITLASSPQKLMAKFVSDTPLTFENYPEWTDAQINALVEEKTTEMQTSNSVSLTGEELTRIIQGTDKELENIKFEVTEDDELVLSFSHKIDQNNLPSEDSPFISKDGSDQYFNLKTKVDAEIIDGRFTKFKFKDLIVGKVNIGALIGVKDFSEEINQNMAQQSLQTGDENPLQYIDIFEIKNGEINVKIDPKLMELNNNPGNEMINFDETNFQN